MTRASSDSRRLATALVNGARAELELTPKPGLVDRADNGSHPDLSFELMSRSIDLLPRYFEELLEQAGAIRQRPVPAGVVMEPAGLQPGPDVDLDACIAAGRRAEERMAAAIGSNTHRGYIFLSGLALLAVAARAPKDGNGARPEPLALTDLRRDIADLAARILARHQPDAVPSHGGDLRRQLHVGGIHAEALDGLPSVFDHGLPALEHGLAVCHSVEAARHYLMAALMTAVEDTTALHRCGRAGLDRLRRDGSQLQALIEHRQDYLPLLLALNDEYRAMRLTMGGVADCMALTIALSEVRGTAMPGA